MGFLNKNPIIKAEGFHPIDLNEDNVQAIFNRCVAKEGENFYNVQVVGLELSKNPSDIVQLSGEKMEKKRSEYPLSAGPVENNPSPQCKSNHTARGFLPI